MEQFGLFIVLALIALAQLLFRVLQRRAGQGQGRPPAPARPSPAEVALPPTVRHWPLPAPPSLVVRPAPAPAADTRPAPPAPRRRFASRAELRRAIVLMEVLGPCRAGR